MDQRELVGAYFDCLQRGDGPGAAALFCPDGVLDDGNGGHHDGPDQIIAFIGSLAAGVTVEQVRVIERPARVTVFGRVGSAELSMSTFRWIFHLRDGRIAHLGNSFVASLPA